MQILDKNWQDWIRDNFSRGCIREDMLKVMINAGVPEQTALFNLASYSDEVANNKTARTNSIMLSSELPSNKDFQQEASYLFQHENYIVTKDGQHIQVTMRIDTPDVVLLDNFMTHAECDELCQLSINTLSKSTVVDDATGKTIDHAERVSQGTYFTIGQNDLVKRIEARISEITSIPVCNGEGLQILNYVRGGEYRPHFDYFPDSEGGRIHTLASGQRIITIIMYLNDVSTGGATIFPNINLSIYPKKGSALYFSYYNSLGQVDANTLHGGSPVIDGEKWIATKWLREREYR